MNCAEAASSLYSKSRAPTFLPSVTDILNNSCTPHEAILKELNTFPDCAALIKEANDVITRCQLPPLEIRIEKVISGFYAEQEDNIIRIISARKATKKEKKDYEQL